MWRILLSLLILFAVGRAAMFLLNWFEPKEKFSYIEVTIYSFSMGYAFLTIADIALAQFGFLSPSINLLVISLLPVLAVSLWLYKKQQKRSHHLQNLNFEDQSKQRQNSLIHAKTSLSSVHFSHIILLSVLAIGLILRLETQLTVPWLGDQDPYYHLSFIDSIIAQGTMPSRTFWGFYSYPPSFHVVFATLISTVQADRFLFMKIVPEFLGFLCVPAAYALVKRKYGEWAGIASAAFLAICSFHIYRTNIAIPEPIALLGMLLFFHSVATLTGSKKYLFAGFFASIIFLTNPIAMLYFLPSVVAIFLLSVVVKRKNDAATYLKAIFVGLLLSGIFWLPLFYRLGLNGILEGWGPSYPYYGVFSFNSNTYFSWIGWGACLLAIVGAFVCLKDFRNNLILLIPALFFLFLIEAGNNHYYLFEATVLFRGLLFLGTWVSLLAGVGFWQVLQKRSKRIAATTLAILVIFTALSFPLLSGNRYPVNWGYEDIDFVYKSYLENYADLFKDKSYMIYSSEETFNYGAFSNVILPRETPQIKDALLRNESSTMTALVNKYNIKYLIFRNGTTEAEFLLQSNLAYTYYENWHTIVLEIR